jgi:hypothetical protein
MRHLGTKCQILVISLVATSALAQTGPTTDLGVFPLGTTSDPTTLLTEFDEDSAVFYSLTASLDPISQANGFRIIQK